MATKLLIIAIVQVATIYGAPHTAQVKVPVQTLVVRSNFHAQDELGQYAYGYNSEDGQYKKEVKSLDGTVRGVYGYDSPDGRHVLVRYKADDGGFVAQSDFIEQPGKVPVIRPVITVTQQETVPDPREGEGIHVQEEVDDTETGVQVDEDAYSNPGYSSYQQGTYYVSDDGTYEVSPYQPAASYVTSKSTSHKYYSSDTPVASTTQSSYNGGLSDYVGYTSQSPGYSYVTNAYSSTPEYSYSYKPVETSSSSHKYYSSQSPVVYAVHEPDTNSHSQYAGYGYAASGPQYDKKLYYPSKTSVVYIPPPEPRVYYPKEDSYVHKTPKPVYEVRPVISVIHDDSYKPNTRVAVNVLHHGSPDIAIAPIVPVTPVPLLYTPSPVVKVHVGSTGVSSSAFSYPGTYQVTPAPVVKTVSLPAIQVKVNKPAVQSGYVVSSTPKPFVNSGYVVSSTPKPFVSSGYVVSSTPTPLKVVNPTVYKTKHVSVANPFKYHYLSPSVKVNTPSLHAYSPYINFPSSVYNTVSSYATAGTQYPYKSFPFASYSYLPTSSLHGAYQPAYYYIQSPMAAVQSNPSYTYVPAASSVQYSTPVKVDVKPALITRHKYKK